MSMLLYILIELIQEYVGDLRNNESFVHTPMNLPKLTFGSSETKITLALGQKFCCWQKTCLVPIWRIYCSRAWTAIRFIYSPDMRKRYYLDKVKVVTYLGR